MTRLEHFTAEVRPFTPARWASGCHVQTLLARALRPSRGPVFRRERLETPDGDFIDVDWGPEVDAHAPIVLVLHGLEGSSTRRYVLSASRELLACGIRPVAMNFRGCSGESNRALHFYHSGDTRDPAWLLGLIRERHPGRLLGALGFSLGGNVLLKMLGERTDGGAGLLDAAAAMSVPYDLAAGSALMERTRMGRFYSDYFMRSLLSKVRSKHARLAEVLDMEAVVNARTIWEFDEHATAPLNGFRDAADYYARSSSTGFVPDIRVPTLLLHSEDDPFLPREAIPIAAARENPWLTLSLQSRGGHVGFLGGTLRAPRFWGEEEAARFLGGALAFPRKPLP